jgi:hypothetical protein
MKYLLLIYMDENAMSDTEREHCYVESAQVAQDLHAKGQFVASAPLHPVATATSVQVRQGNSLVTDGPFAKTREQLGGFFLVNAQDLDEAIALPSAQRSCSPPASQVPKSAPSKFALYWKLRDYQYSHDRPLAIQRKPLNRRFHNESHGLC